MIQQNLKGCKNNIRSIIRAEEEQITAARAKQHEDEEEDTGIKPKELKTVFPSKHHEGIYFVNMQKNQETRFLFLRFFFCFPQQQQQQQQ